MRTGLRAQTHSGPSRHSLVRVLPYVSRPRRSILDVSAARLRKRSRGPGNAVDDLPSRGIVIRRITCREFVDFLDDYLARRLETPQLAEFDNHLSGCPPCVAYMQTYKDSMSLGKGALGRSDEPVPEAIPEDLVAVILAAREKAGS
jgi:hypothetical protein